MKVAQVRAVLFAKDLEGLTAFYAGALGMTQSFADADHAVLHCGGFELIVHRIPKHIAATIAIKQPPERRVGSAVRLDYPVASIEASRSRDGRPFPPLYSATRLNHSMPEWRNW